MSEDRAIDLIRWTFTIDPSRASRIEAYLTDLGLDVHIQGGTRLVVTWDEPDGDADEIIEGLWAAYGESFEVTHEEFHRVNLLSLNHEDPGEPDFDCAVA